METQQLAIILPLLIPVPITFYLVVHFARRRAAVDIPLALLITAAGIWSAGYALELILNDYSAMLLASRLQYIALVMAPTAWLLLGLQFQDKLSILGRWGPYLLLVMPIFTLVLVFTSGYHNFFWLSKEIVHFNGLTLFNNAYGPGFWMHTAYSYTLNIAGAALAFGAATKTNLFYRRQKISIILAFILPWVANIVYVFRLTSYPIDFSPFALIASAMILMVGVFRYRLGDLVPVARERIIDEMGDAMLVLDEMQRVVDYNRALEKLFPDQAISFGESVDELLFAHPELQKLIAHQQESIEQLYTGFSNRVFRISSELINSRQDTKIKLIILRDLSSENRIQDALRLVIEGTSQDVGEDFYRSLARHLSLALATRHAMVAVLDEENANRLTSLAFWSDDGYQENISYDVAGTPCECAIEQNACVYLEDVIRQFPTDAALVEFNVESYLGMPLRNHAGKPIGVLAVFSDKAVDAVETGKHLLSIFAMRAAAEIERRRNEQRLETSEENYRRIVETTKDGVCVVNGCGVVEIVNEPMMQLLAGDANELFGKAVNDFFPAEASLPNELTSREDANFEFRFTNFAGDAKSVAISKTAIVDGDGQGASMLYIFQDLTEKQLLEAANKDIETKLRQAQKMESLGVLAGGVAHDFNNLLMPILGYIDLIKERVSANKVVLEYLNLMHSSSEKLANLCNQMLTYSGSGHFVKTAIDVEEQILDIKEFIRATVPSSFPVTYHIEDPLPAIMADTTQFNQVLMNLIINASESMHRNQGGSITVRAGQARLDGLPQSALHFGESLQPGNYVYIEVQDDGAGISAENQSRLFEPFFTTKFTGRGLGMAVVFGIVKAHNGAIEIHSEVGVGTNIRIYFPATTEPITRNATPIQLAGTSPGAGKILVVDDEPEVRLLMRRMLKKMGFEVIEAEDGARCLEVFGQHQSTISACIIDLTMPGMDGVELLSRIRQISAHLPILLVSGYSREQVPRQDLDAENVGFLQKPFTFATLKTSIDEQMAGRAEQVTAYKVH